MTDAPLPICEYCGDEIPPPDPDQQIVGSGGWCVPSANLYAIDDWPTRCVDCKSREMVIMELGIDPGRNGENLRVPPGGIKYTTAP